jgi:hypothetical protein
MSRVVALYLAGVIVVVVLLSVGLVLDQPIAASAAVVVALAVGLLALLPQLLSANGNRYAEHKEYFASNMLPQAGSLVLVSGDGVVFLPPDRIAWKLRDDRAPIYTGAGETPFFREMLRPHLQRSAPIGVWADFSKAFFHAEDRVSEYTAARRKFDAAFNTKMAAMIRDRIGKEFRAAWWSERARDFTVAESKYAIPTYNAKNIRSPCLMWYEGRYEREPGMHWEHRKPVPAQEDRNQGLSWRLKVGDGDGLDFLWGGPVPTSLQDAAAALEGIIDELRNDGDLKRLYLASKVTEEEAENSLEALPLGAENAASLLRHGPDIPGSCTYCAGWSPRI